MVTINKTINISGGVAPYNYSWSIVAQPGYEGCVQINSPSGTLPATSGGAPVVLTTEFIYSNADCLNNTSATLDVNDSQGCVTKFSVLVQDPCVDLVLTDITQTNPFIFTANASGTFCAEYDYYWSFDTSVFRMASTNVSNINSNTIQLELITKSPPLSTVVQVTVVDCNGCTAQKEITYNFCVPQAIPQAAALICVSNPPSTIGSCTNVHASTGQVTLVAGQNCAFTKIDWSTLEVFNPVSGICVSQINSGNKIYITADDTVVPGTYQLTWTVADTLGITSNIATINITVAGCGKVALVVPDKTFQIDCSLLSCDTFDMPIDACIPPG